METVVGFIYLGSKITDSDCNHEMKRCLLLGRKAMTNLDRVWTGRDITLLTKVHIVKAMVFSVVMYGCQLDHKEGCMLKKWCFWTVVLRKILESPLDSKEIKPVSLKGDQPWIVIGMTNAEAEAPILWPPDGKSWLIGQDPWCWERLRAVGEGGNRGWDGWMASSIQWTWIWANPERYEGQESLACCSPWGCKELDMSE